MAKYNIKQTTPKSTNYEGGEAFEIADKEQKLLHLTATCLFNEPKFYGERGETEDKIFELCKTVDPKFMLQLASYLRNEQYLRTTPNVLLTLASTRPEAKGTNLITTYAPNIIKRADEIAEVLAMYQSIFVPDRTKATKTEHPLKLPNSLKKAIAKSFTQFNEYQFAKYNHKGKVTFKDAIMLTHPKEPSAIIKKILDDKLEVPFTWETELSKGEDKKATWEKLIKSGKLPYMALIRNLRNILEANVSDEHIDSVILKIKNQEAVEKSKLFPFRFYQAYRELEHLSNPNTSYILDSLTMAMDYAFSKIPHMNGTTFIACDTSGSMNSPLSERSTLELKDVGLLLGVASHRFTEKSILSCFAESFGVYQIRKTSSLIDNLQKINEWSQQLGGSTNGYKAIQYLNQNNISVDRILMFTDCQLYDSSGWGIFSSYREDMKEHTVHSEFNAYRKINPQCKLYLFDLRGHGTINFPESNRSVVNVSGWSEKIFNFIQLHEVNPKAQVEYIKRKY